jgi:hypothetical protein
MARSPDDSGDRWRSRPRKPKADPGYEVLPDDESDDEPHGAEYRRRRWGDEEEKDERPRRRRRRGPGIPPVARLLGMACAVSAILQGLITLAVLAWLILGIVSGRWPHRFLVGSMILFGFLAQYYARIAWKVWQADWRDIEFGRCVLASLTIGGLAAMISLPPLWILRNVRDVRWTDPPMLAAEVGVVAAGLTVVVAGLAFLTQEEARRPRRQVRW